MPSELPLQRDLKPRRSAAWIKHTEEMKNLELARQVIAANNKDVDERKLSQHYSTYRCKAQPTFPKLEACVEVESLLKLAKGQIYLAITKMEQELHVVLEQRFGELPLRFDAKNKQYYNAESSNTEVEVSADMTVEQFEYILNKRNVKSSQLAQAIGGDIHWQKIARLRRLAREGSTESLPEDIAGQLVEGLQKIADAPPVESGSEESTPRTQSRGRRRESSEAQVAGDELRIFGLGGLDIAVAAKLNLKKLRLENKDGKLLVRDKVLHIPPIPLSDQQREVIRTWIAKTVASEIV